MRDKKLLRYLILTFSISWTFWILNAGLVKITSLKQSDLFSIILLLTGGVGPTIAACLSLDEGFSWRNVGLFLKKHKNGSGIILFIFITIEIIFFLIVSKGIDKSIPRSPLAIFVFIITFIETSILFGGNEELGWRGIMHPILMKKFPNILVPLIIG